MRGSEDALHNTDRNEVSRELSTSMFDLVGQSDRAAILTALGEHSRKDFTGEGLAFSTLREQVGHDDPGNFNYHLQQLEDGPVEQTEAGYRLSTVGQRLLSVITAERFDPDRTIELDAQTDCLVCGEESPVEYTDNSLKIDCSTHSIRFDIGAGVVDRLGATAACRIGLRQATLDTASFQAGVCPGCEGAVESELVVDNGNAWFEATCRCCGLQLSNTPAGCVLDHPAVISLCWRHDIDVRREGQRVLATHTESHIADQNPIRVAVQVSVEADSIRLLLDDNGTVCEVEE